MDNFELINRLWITCEQAVRKGETRYLTQIPGFYVDAILSKSLLLHPIALFLLLAASLYRGLRSAIRHCDAHSLELGSHSDRDLPPGPRLITHIHYDIHCVYGYYTLYIIWE